MRSWGERRLGAAHLNEDDGREVSGCAEDTLCAEEDESKRREVEERVHLHTESTADVR